MNNFNRFQSGLLVVCLVTVADGACDVPANAVTTTEQMSFCAAFCQPVQEELLCALARDVPNLNADAF